MICLHLQAPFGVFRTFTSGSFRPTAGFVTPSAAYGLLLNAAGIEMRRDDGASLMTLISKDLPPLKLALGAIEWPTRHSIFQQLHNYPVGATGKEHAPNTKGGKYNIVPARREFLADVKGYICADGDRELESRILEGLRGERPRAYGLPFLGDNNFLPDRLEPVTEPLPAPAYWMERVPEGEEEIRDNVMRLTITVDRMDLSRSRSVLFAPSKDKGLSPTPKSWVEVNYR